MSPLVLKSTLVLVGGLSVLFLYPLAADAAPRAPSAIIRHADRAPTKDELTRTFGWITEELSRGESVYIENFGRFYIQEWRSRSKKTGAPKAPRQIPRFRSSENLKRVLNSQELK